MILYNYIYNILIIVMTFQNLLILFITDNNIQLPIITL